MHLVLVSLVFALNTSLILAMSSILGQSTRSLVLCGPSGAGKGSIISSICKVFPQQLALSVSHTTRTPRVGEVNGVHYNFVSVEAMTEGIDNGSFFEHAKVHDNFYGTSFQAVESIHKTNRIALLDLDVKGVISCKEKSSSLPARFVFIAPPSVESLESRLQLRGTESQAQVDIRLQNARKELEFGTLDNFDLVLINDDLATACGQLTEKMKEWFPVLALSSVASK